MTTTALKRLAALTTWWRKVRHQARHAQPRRSRVPLASVAAIPGTHFYPGAGLSVAILLAVGVLVVLWAAYPQQVTSVRRPVMIGDITIGGTVVSVEITEEHLAAARASLLRFGQPGDGFWDIVAGSYVRAAQDRLAYPLPGRTSAQAYGAAVRDLALIAAYADLTGTGAAGGAR